MKRILFIASVTINIAFLIIAAWQLIVCGIIMHLMPQSIFKIHLYVVLILLLSLTFLFCLGSKKALKKKTIIIVLSCMSFFVFYIGYRWDDLLAEYHFRRLTNSSLTDEQRARAVGSLAEFEKKEYLMKGFKSPDDFVRKYSVMVLGRIEVDTNIIIEIAKHLKDESNPEIIGVGLRTLYRSQDPPQKVKRFVTESLDHTSAFVRISASRGLIRMQYGAPEKVMPILIDMLKDEDVANRIADELKLFTNMDFGKDHAKWKEWWEENKDTFEPHEYWH